MRLLAAWPLLVACTALAVQDGILFQDAARSLVLRGFDNHRLSRTVTEVRFSGSGTPAIIEAKTSGALLQAQEVSGTARVEGKLMTLQEAQLSGNAVIVIDTKARETFILSQNAAAAPAREHSRTRLDSSVLDYKGNSEMGTVTANSKLHLVSDSAGTRTVKKDEKDVERAFTQSLDLVGSKGAITLDPRGKTSVAVLRKGSVEGPVDFVYRGTEKDSDAKEPTLTNLVGRGDLLTFDFTTPDKTITLSGNVHMVGTGSFAGETNVDKLIITVDDNLQPIRYETEGKPTTTRIKPGGGTK
jgi:hypothetical protein